MFKRLIVTFILTVVFISTLFAGDTTRYRDLVFKDVIIKKDISYAANMNISDKKAYLLDLYLPAGDLNAKRPLIIWMHGGGFKFGSKEAKSMQLWCKTFAQRGYVCAAINYRLSKKNTLFHFDELRKATYFAVQDAKTAIDFFKRNYEPYGVDPDKIILAGNSAGGFIALQAAYTSNAALAAKVGLADTVERGHATNIVKIAGVINLWGALFDLDWLKNASVPIVSILGSNDSVVPPTHKNDALYGGIDIHERADSLRVPNRLKVFNGYSHELHKHFNPLFSGGAATEKRWLEAGQFAADFLYERALK